MARKNIISPYLVNQDPAISLQTAFQTEPTLISYQDNCSYQINISTNDSTGNFSVQGSLDYQVDSLGQSVINPGNWVDLVLGGGVPTAAGANDTILIDLNQLPFNAIRIAYSPLTPGNGTCAIYVMTKQVGG